MSAKVSACFLDPSDCIYRFNCSKVIYFKVSRFHERCLIECLTISSRHIGQVSLLLAAAPVDGPPLSSDALDIKSWPASGSGDVAKGESVDSLELSDKELADGEITSEAVL